MDINKIIARVKGILLSPRAEWPIIAAVPDTVGSLFSGYICIVAAIPAVIHFLTMSVIGQSTFILGTYRAPITRGLEFAALSYVLSLISVFVLALIVEALAPTFGGEKNRVQAVKAVAYSYTAGWVASVIGIVPGLGIISALAGLVDGLYLLETRPAFHHEMPAREITRLHGGVNLSRPSSSTSSWAW